MRKQLLSCCGRKRCRIISQPASRSLPDVCIIFLFVSIKWWSKTFSHFSMKNLGKIQVTVSEKVFVSLAKWLKSICRAVGPHHIRRFTDFVHVMFGQDTSLIFAYVHIDCTFVRTCFYCLSIGRTVVAINL